MSAYLAQREIRGQFSTELGSKGNRDKYDCNLEMFVKFQNGFLHQDILKDNAGINPAKYLNHVLFFPKCKSKMLD